MGKRQNERRVGYGERAVGYRGVPAISELQIATNGNIEMTSV